MHVRLQATHSITLSCVSVLYWKGPATGGLEFSVFSDWKKKSFGPSDKKHERTFCSSVSLARSQPFLSSVIKFFPVWCKARQDSQLTTFFFFLSHDASAA